MEESSSSAAGTAATNDGRDLSELLRSMTTTTTIERFDEPTTKAAISTTSTELPPVVPQSENKGGPCLPHASSVPTSISRSYKVWGVPTHAFCQVFSDRIVVGVTQLQTTKLKESSSGHIGSWVYCQASRSQIDPRQVDYELSTLLGGASMSASGGNNRDEKEVYARRVAERLLEKKSVPGGSDRVVLLLGISLLSIKPSSSPSSIDRFNVLVEVLVELVEEALGIALG
jgi:hypothetical protein